ncbi:IS110 family transposase [Paenibacillus sp. 19GGS1-52]|uniref:IS110 family transposase n=1 Tax=Paenibacillus sp. 19GGS1-52 TaxID=2758563 RepID=UPI001EFB949B|nr:IS110 family transposase [Paenibacillus sp. 19GGS1-52]ULO05768.1 IS110 family transposase [Paenibacillus sp. 19GGS1-52]ULO05854.1 IS110 family transposase [Paenibacillus sp. 19GGS1-52]ULO07896.1 IS110 family transposase [Paenibacillus sp. 19GGS1-52]ULO09299.1 IS110 family transposase [Paenibacillus sp. 19GGS1-52]ULO09749.1 IS110 family transposase [Paenibacillus sp. 19GGS1-52]
MEILIERCCGLDVHKKSITACIITSKGKEIRSFETLTRRLIDLVDWIKSERCTHVAMESTGDYWKPIYNLLEMEDLEPLVVNAQHIKAVPGRKTDVKDAEWIAKLLRHGLVQGSYIPNRDQRELREIIRYRRSIIEERTREVNRLQKVLEGGNIKLSSVASNVLGVSGRNMLEAMIQGESDPSILADFAQKKLKAKKEQLKLALEGSLGPHQLLMLEKQLSHIDQLNELITELDEEIERRMSPFAEDLKLLDTIPGVGKRTAEQILAEIGTDMTRFPSAGHLCSWAGMTPGHDESAGKKRSAKTRKGNKKLRSALVESARAAGRKKNTYLSAQYHRIAGRRGKNRAAVAVGHSILAIVYILLTRRQEYKELGFDYFDQRNHDMVMNRSIKRLESLGYQVNLSEQTA